MPHLHFIIRNRGVISPFDDYFMVYLCYVNIWCDLKPVAEIMKDSSMCTSWGFHVKPLFPEQLTVHWVLVWLLNSWWLRFCKCFYLFKIIFKCFQVIISLMWKEMLTFSLKRVCFPIRQWFSYKTRHLNAPSKHKITKQAQGCRKLVRSEFHEESDRKLRAALIGNLVVQEWTGTVQMKMKLTPPPRTLATRPHTGASS